MLTVTIQTDSHAIEEGGGAEIARILRGLADRIESEGVVGADNVSSETYVLRDINGARVGKAVHTGGN